MKVLGIDLAAQPKKTFACSLRHESGALLGELHRECSDEDLIGLARGNKKVAVDAPFGWPDDFVDAVNAHAKGMPWPAPEAGDADAFRRTLSFRATDEVVRQTRHPLSVSTDKLGVTAMRCALLLHRWSADRKVDRAGVGTFVEVYPAASLVRWSLDPSGYKGNGNRKARQRLLQEILEQLPALQLGEEDRNTCEANDDALDALIAALTAGAAVLGLTDGPPPSSRERAERGMDPSSAARLAPTPWRQQEQPPDQTERCGGKRSPYFRCTDERRVLLVPARRLCARTFG